MKVDYDSELGRMTFFKEAEEMPPHAMMQMMDGPPPPHVNGAYSAGAGAENSRGIAAKSSRR